MCTKACHSIAKNVLSGMLLSYVAELCFEGNFVTDFEKNILRCFRILRHFGIKMGIVFR